MKQLMLNNKEVLAEMLKSKGFIVAVASFGSYLVVTYRYDDGIMEDDYIDFDLSGKDPKIISHSKTFDSMMEKRDRS